MLSMKEAYEKVRNQGKGADRLYVYESETQWIFVFEWLSEICGRELPRPGGPLYSVDKDTGKVTRFSIPPISNLQMVMEAVKIPQETIKMELDWLLESGSNTTEGNGRA